MTSGTALAAQRQCGEGPQREQGLGRARQRIGPWLPDCLRRHHARTGDVAALARLPCPVTPGQPVPVGWPGQAGASLGPAGQQRLALPGLGRPPLREALGNARSQR